MARIPMKNIIRNAAKRIVEMMVDTPRIDAFPECFTYKTM